MFRIKFPTEHTFQIFSILKINGLRHFVNLFTKRSSYLTKTKVNLAFHLSGVGKSSTVLFGWG